MGLLDVNVPRQLKSLFDELGVSADSASERGWGAIANGDSLQEATAAGCESESADEEGSTDIRLGSYVANTRMALTGYGNGGGPRASAWLYRL